MSVFVPNGISRKETAVLLVGTATEYGLPQSDIRAVFDGFLISDELADILADTLASEPEVEDGEIELETEDYFDPADYTIDQVQSFVNDYPETAADVLASEQDGKNRVTLTEWLAEFIKTSGNRAAKTGTDKE